MRRHLALACTLVVPVLAACGPSSGEGETAGGFEDGGPAAAGAAEPSPRDLLERSAAALAAVESVRYDFTWGGPDDPTGWLSGTVWMRQREDAAASWIRVEGTVHAQPARGIGERSFAYGRDGETAWAVEGDGELETAPVGAGGNRLSATAVYAWLPELVERQPLWRELGMAGELELLAPVTIDGEVCDVVRVVIAPEEGAESEIHWAIARGDRLPRRGRWFMPRAGPEGMVLTLEALETGVELERADFAPPSPAGGAAPITAAVGDPAPPWTLSTPDGGEVRLADLEGEVVVLDFWNTWCPVCRSIAPATRELAAEMAGRPVRFFAVNLFETGDPVAYWRQAGEPYPLLLAGEEVAAALDIPWQPGIAVIGPQGTVLHKQLGASADRVASVRAAIEEGLERVPSSG